MAWYVDFTAECESEGIAQLVHSAFVGQKVEAAGRDVLFSRVNLVSQNDLWYVLVSPAGLGWNPGGPYVEELHTPQAMSEIREGLYNLLRPVSGFRRALFAEEAYDTLACWSDLSDFMLFELPHLVIAEHLIPDAELRSFAVPFSPGYVRLEGMPDGMEGFHWRAARRAKKK